MSLNLIQHAARTNATGTGSTSATATVTGTAGHVIYITDIAASSDKSGAILLVKDGSTTIWQQIIGATAYWQKFESPLAISSGADAVVSVDGTSACKANIAGFIQ